ncbi:tumor necrosis factor receptor superfamily member 14 isoform X2 [Marmota marmota marmota]|uniref:tumor necrosis factor receptor superfamily member 14 isoform X2 n=1 Tax=Marmota marmota marmota TaxID=9994 RepID=UPI002093E63A|nr:tumor necrosis factor receptor superfamily member 14 isoform X2 [Marmota marmota marmota]
MESHPFQSCAGKEQAGSVGRSLWGGVACWREHTHSTRPAAGNPQAHVTGSYGGPGKMLGVMRKAASPGPEPRGLRSPDQGHGASARLGASLVAPGAYSQCPEAGPVSPPPPGIPPVCPCPVPVQRGGVPCGHRMLPQVHPGYHVKQACSELTGTVCIPCPPPDDHTAHPNGLSRCLPCRVCDPALGLDTRQKCSSMQDTVCGGRHGYFCEAEDREHGIMCLPHTICHPGQRVQRRGTDSQDTVCANCPLGTFSPNGTLDQCLPWTTGLFAMEAEPGTSSRDVSCSLSRGFYVFVSVLPLSVVIVLMVWVRRKRPCGSERSETVVLQRQVEEEAGESAVTQAPKVTTVAEEETVPVLRAVGPHR